MVTGVSVEGQRAAGLAVAVHSVTHPLAAGGVGGAAVGHRHSVVGPLGVTVGRGLVLLRDGERGTGAGCVAQMSRLLQRRHRHRVAVHVCLLNAALALQLGAEGHHRPLCPRLFDTLREGGV